MAKKIQLYLYCALCLLFLLFGKLSFGMIIDVPVIKAGTAKLTGTIASPNTANNNGVFVNIVIPHPISGTYTQYKALVDASGKFSMDVNLETSISLIRLHTDLNPEEALLVKLKNGELTHLDIAYNADDDIENISVRPDMNKNDMIRCFDLIREMLMIQTLPGRGPEPLRYMSPDYFMDYINAVLSERLAIVNKDTLLSKELKGVLYKEFRLHTYERTVFDYKGQMKKDYRTGNDDKDKELYIQKIDRSYFHFLRDFKLNDPQYLNTFSFLEFQQKILQNDVLALPEVGESDVSSWLIKVKAILSDLVGFENGPYYDILAANAYSRQLMEEVRPLSEKQKKNISAYWKNGEIAKILFRKNQEVIELDKFRSPLIVNDISSVADDKVIETITTKHKGKVIFVDLWATWCVPCLNAMQEFRSTKSEFHNKDVVFVYLSNASSPRKLWEEKIKGIGGEHYYLTDLQWEYIMNKFGFEYIPSYLLYNKESILVNKFSAFPGSAEVKKMINDLL